jgi:hypothetical protein
LTVGGWTLYSTCTVSWPIPSIEHRRDIQIERRSSR